MKKKNIIYWISLMFFVMSVSACKVTQPKTADSTAAKEPTEMYTIVTEPHTVSMDNVDGTTAIITKVKRIPELEKFINGEKYNYLNSYPMATQEYLVYEDSEKRLDTEYKEERKVIVEKFKLHVYKISTQGITYEKEIDMKKVLKKYNPAYSPYLVEGIGFVNNRSYAIINVYDNEKKKFGVKKVYVDVANEEVIEKINNESIFVGGRLYDTAQNIYDTPSNMYLEKVTNLSDRFFAGKSSAYSFSYGDEVSQDAQLLQTFPNLKEYFELESDQYGILLVPDLSISVENIAQWLLPEGENMYDGLILYGEYSKDGKDHEIHSMEEFLEWFQKKGENE